MAGVMHLSPEELAIRWHMKAGTLSKWRQRGCGPVYIKFGRSVLYPMDAIEAHEQAHMRKAVSVPL